MDKKNCLFHDDFNCDYECNYGGCHFSRGAGAIHCPGLKNHIVSTHKGTDSCQLRMESFCDMIVKNCETCEKIRTPRLEN